MILCVYSVGQDGEEHLVKVVTVIDIVCVFCWSGQEGAPGQGGDWLILFVYTVGQDGEEHLVKMVTVVDIVCVFCWSGWGGAPGQGGQDRRQHPQPSQHPGRLDCKSAQNNWQCFNRQCFHGLMEATLSTSIVCDTLWTFHPHPSSPSLYYILPCPRYMHMQ